MRKAKKELEALRGWPSKDKTLYKGGIASSQIENEEGEGWQEGDQMARQWEEEQHLDDLIERRRMEGSSLKLDTMQKVTELVVNKRMSQGEKEKYTKEKKKVPGLFIEEMKERPNIAVKEDTEEMKRWRSLNQSETNLFWKNLAERMEEEVLDKYKVEESKKGTFKGRGNPLEWRRVRRSEKYRNAAEITTELIDFQLLPTVANVERGIQNLEFVLQEMHTAQMALASYEANDIVANSRKNPSEAWRRLQKRYDPTSGGRKTKLAANDHFCWKVLSFGTSSRD